MVLSPKQHVAVTGPEPLCGLSEYLVYVTAVLAGALQRRKSATGHFLKRQHAN